MSHKLLLTILCLLISTKILAVGTGGGGGGEVGGGDGTKSACHADSSEFSQN